MIRGQNTKMLVVLKQQTISNGGTLTSDVIDTREFDYLSLIVHGTTSDAATNNPSVLKLQESDDTVSTNFADITAFVGDGTGGFVIPNSPTATTTAPLVKMDADLTARKRYLRLVVSALTNQTYSVIATLQRARELPNSTTEANCAALVVG